MTAVLTGLLFMVIAMFDVPKLLQKKKELIVYTCVLGLAFILTELHLLRLPVWGPNQLFIQLVKWFKPNT